MVTANEFEGRRAPYAPVSALREFFERMREISVPGRVDRRFLQKLNVASNNEWALLSALKFLGVVDEHGAPTHAYRLLQTTDRFEETLRHLVETAYRDLFAAGGASMSLEDLQNYFRITSSPSQAKNAARFFREVCQLAGIGRDFRAHPATARANVVSQEDGAQPAAEVAGLEEVEPAGARPYRAAPPQSDLLLSAKARLLEKLPPARPEWSAAEYEAICARFAEMLRSLEGV